MPQHTRGPAVYMNYDTRQCICDRIQKTHVYRSTCAFMTVRSLMIWRDLSHDVISPYTQASVSVPDRTPARGKNCRVLLHGSQNVLRAMVGSSTLFYPALPKSGPDRAALRRKEPVRFDSFRLRTLFENSSFRFGSIRQLLFPVRRGSACTF